jgi:phosphohistidine phosphatase
VNIYLVRHGQAVQDAANPRRPLSDIGKREVERVAHAAVAKKVHIDEIFHSGILRAQQTAEILAHHLAPRMGVRAIQGLAPQDDPLVAKVELEAAQHSLMLVGHLPHMSRLATLLVAGDADREVVGFTPATVVCCVHDESGWAIRWALTPQSAGDAFDP